MGQLEDLSTWNFLSQPGLEQAVRGWVVNEDNGPYHSTTDATQSVAEGYYILKKYHNSCWQWCLYICQHKDQINIKECKWIHSVWALNFYLFVNLDLRLRKKKHKHNQNNSNSNVIIGWPIILGNTNTEQLQNNKSSV